MTPGGPETTADADLSFLTELFSAFKPLRGEGYYGIDIHVRHGSPLVEDDKAAQGYGPSILARQFLTTAADHEHALETLATSGIIGAAAPWALMRCTLEALAQAAYVLCPPTREDRVAHALQLSYHDYTMANKYHAISGRLRGGRGQVHLLELARKHGIAEKKVKATVGYGKLVAEAGPYVGVPATEAEARWQEASAYSHGRNWTTLSLGVIERADRTSGGWNVLVTLDETKLARISDLTARLATAVVDRFRQLATSPFHRR